MLYGVKSEGNSHKRGGRTSTGVCQIDAAQQDSELKVNQAALMNS